MSMDPRILSGCILASLLYVFALGRSPLFRVDRAGAAIIGGLLTLVAGLLSFEQAAAALDVRTLILLFSMMVLTAHLKLAGFFETLGAILLARVNTRRGLLLAVVLASGGLSACFINDVVCLLFTPVVLLACLRARLNPVPYLLAVALSANVGSAATLVGNPQNILVGSLSGLSFARYALWAAPVSLLGLLATFLALCLLYRRELAGPLPPAHPIPGIRHTAVLTKALVTAGGVLLAFFSGVDAAIAAGLGAAFLLFTRRIKPNKVYASIDFNLLLIFSGLFVVMGGVEKSGLARWTLERCGAADLGSFAAFAGLTVALSNVFSNVPAVMLLRYLVPHGDTGWWAGLALFSTLAGNLTLTGSIANLIVAELAQAQGVRISFGDYLRVGVPLTLFLVLAGWGYFTWVAGV